MTSGRLISSTRKSVSFGSFHLYPVERRLEKCGVVVSIGARALDILIALVSRAGEVVSNHELMQAGWPATTVCESNLRMQMTTLRRALGSESAGCVSNVPGRGYCFVAPVVWTSRIQDNIAPSVIATRRPPVPPRLMRMIGRDQTVEEISDKLARVRFVNLIGAAGVGKTTVAIHVSHRLRELFNDDVYFLDLGALRNSDLVPTALLSALGLSVAATDLMQSLQNFTQDGRSLILFDNCEHVVDAVAPLAEEIFQRIHNISILATSREPMRVEGEQVYRLLPLECPPLSGDLRASEAMTYSAVQLFVDRISMTTDGFALGDEDAPAAAEICARFDGIPLAIEIAAGRADTFGIQKTAALLADRLGLIWQGRRTALPRHQTLTAALDWSYGLLSAFEQLTLRRLSIFVGTFTLEAARACHVCEVDVLGTAEAIAVLVSKSLISLIPHAPSGRFQMLQTTRAYALTRLKESGVVNEVAGQHAKYFLHFLAHLNDEASILSVSDAFATYGEHLGNVRAALEWSFSPDGDSALAVSLASHSGQLFLEMSLLPECRTWMRRAAEHFTKVQPNGQQEMQICAALGVSAMFTLGGTPEAGRAFERGLELALELGNWSYALGLLAMLNIYRLRIGDSPGALEVALRGETIAKDLQDPAALLVSRWTLGVSYHQLGDFARAQSNCETALLPQPDSRRRSAVRFLGYDHRVRTLVVEALSLWLRGYPIGAVRTAQIAMQEAEHVGQSIPLCVAYLCACTVRLWAGDLSSADAVIEQTIVYAKKYSLLPFHAAGLGFRGSVWISKGNVELGISMVEECLATLYREKYLVMAVGFAARLAKGLARIQHFAAAREAIETAIELNSSQGDLTYKAHLARVRGEIIASEPNPNLEEAEHSLLTAIDWSQRQSALSVELRAATALGHLWVSKGRSDEAHALVGRVYHLFTEGFETRDLRRAKELLDRLSTNAGRRALEGGVR